MKGIVFRAILRVTIIGQNPLADNNLIFRMLDAGRARRIETVAKETK